MNKQYDISNYMGMIAPPVSNDDAERVIKEMEAAEKILEQLSASVSTYHKNLITTPESCIAGIKIDLADKILEMCK